MTVKTYAGTICDCMSCMNAYGYATTVKTYAGTNCLCLLILVVLLQSGICC
jgi:hypothetical protein